MSAEDFVKKALFLMCEDYSEFLDKTLPQMKDVLKSKGMMVGDVFFMNPFRSARVVRIFTARAAAKKGGGALAGGSVPDGWLCGRRTRRICTA